LERELKKALKKGYFENVDRKISNKMKAIVSSGTKPEVKLRKIVKNILPKNLKIIYNAKIQGKPDIYIPKYKLVIFCDGCFFHGCKNHGHIPSKNSKYWEKKFELNIKRDIKNNKCLRKQGYRVWRIWEHYLYNEETINRLNNILKRRFIKINQSYSESRTGRAAFSRP